MCLSVPSSDRFAQQHGFAQLIGNPTLSKTFVASLKDNMRSLNWFTHVWQPHSSYMYGLFFSRVGDLSSQPHDWGNKKKTV